MLQFAAIRSGSPCFRTFSIVLWVAALAASTCRAPRYASVNERCFSHCCVADGAAPYHQRVGTFVGHVFGSGVRPPAPPEPTRVSANACADHIDAYDEAGQGFFEMALRFGLNAPRERPHMFPAPTLNLTAQRPRSLERTLLHDPPRGTFEDRSVCGQALGLQRA